MPTVAADNYAAYAYARDAGHLDFLAKASTCDNYFEGEQWDPQIRRRLERLGKPVITINKVLPTIAAIWGEVLTHRADVSFRPAKEGEPETAAVLDKLWLHTANANNLDWKEAQMAAEGFIRSRGFLDLRVAFDDHLMGEARITLLNAKNVVVDPDACSYDPDEWKEVFVTKWLSLDDIEATYGADAAQEVESRGAHYSRSQYDTADWLPDTFGRAVDAYAPRVAGDATDRLRRVVRVIERQYVESKWRDHFVDVVTGDIREVPETWDRARVQQALQQFGWQTFTRKVRKVRWTVSTDTVALHDAISPYKHFTPIPFFPFFLHGRTLGVVENMISPQDVLNKSTSQELHVINTTANSGWKMKNGSLQNMTIEELEERGAEDGLVMLLSNPADAEKIQPNQIPSGLDRVGYKADEAIKEISMVSDSMRGFDRADVAAKAIQAKQARGTVSLASAFDNLDQTRRILVRNTLDIFQTFYTEERVIQVVGRTLNAQPEQITINQVTPEGAVLNDLTVGEYSVVLATVPARETFEQSQFQEALEMRQMGIAIPDDVLVEHSHLHRKTELAQRIKDLNGGGEPSQAAQQMEQMELQLKQLELAEKEADAQVKRASAALNAARAQQTIHAASGAGAAEQVKLAAERERMAIEREKMQLQLQLERTRMVAELQLQREKMLGELQLKREQAQIGGALQVQQASHAQALAAQDAQVKAALAKQQADTQAEIAKKKAATASKKPT